MEIQDNKLIIECPEGYEIDKENSTFDLIKFKRIKRWRDCNSTIKGWYMGNNEIKSYNLNGDYSCRWKDDNLNVFATKKQAKSALAMAQISQIMANDERFGGVVTDKEWEDHSKKYTIPRDNMNAICNGIAYYNYSFLAFHTQEQRDLFLKENEDLVKDYLMID